MSTSDAVIEGPSTNSSKPIGFRRGRRLNPHTARTLQPGVSGFLFTVNPQHVDKAKREAMALLGRYCDLVLGEDAATDTAACDGANAGVEQSAVKAHRTESRTTGAVAAALERELAETSTSGPNKGNGTGKCGWKPHPCLRHVETKVKGFIFISVAEPSAEEDSMDAPELPVAEADAAPHEEEKAAVVTPDVATAPEASDPSGNPPGTPQLAGPAGGDLRPENQLVSAIADAMWDDLTQRPRPVARFTYRCYPVPVSTFPTAQALIGEAARRCAMSWRAEALRAPELEDGEEEDEAARAYRTTPVAVWTSVTVRNNSNVDKARDAIRGSMNKALGSDRDAFLVQPFFTDAGAEAISKGRATLFIACMVIHSVALISVQPSYAQRKHYNLGSISAESLQLNNFVNGGD